ncbi:MAG: aminotransferase class V-fold PLP-dependent enzyme [Marinosulfonomonas sp.]|nr:aminotransferase class V-fold PLP-dependent enzyme [Marinosulfonomonas sp.]
MTDHTILKQAAQRALGYRDRVNKDSPYPLASASELRALFDTGLPKTGRPDKEVLTQLANAAEAGLVGSTGDAFYGWVMGASNPVGIAADWLTSAWGQNSAIYQTAPSAAIAEEVAGKYLINLLGLPTEASVAFTTGATMASYIGLSAARSEMLARQGWNLEEQGQFGAPEICVFVSDEAHSAIFAALRYLGFGRERLIMIQADREGRMDPLDLAKKLAVNENPAIIVAQAGHIHTGACDDFETISELASSHGAWLHIDGAFGLWAKASPKLSHLCTGAENADSWAVDGHKWLQVPYDSGFAFVKNKAAHCRAMATTAGYLNETEQDGRNPTYFVPEISRRARGFTVWAILQAMGRDGVANIVEQNSDNAARLADRLRGIPGIRILHQVTLNQLSLVFETPGSSPNNMTQSVVDKLQSDGRWFVKEAIWRDELILRLSFSSFPKTTSQIDEFSNGIIKCWATVVEEYRPVAPHQDHDISNSPRA